MRRAFLVVFFVVAVTSSGVLGMGGRLGDAYAELLKSAMGKPPYERCAEVGEVCYNDKDCCDSRKCVSNSLFLRGPKYACMDVPSRNYRHLPPRVPEIQTTPKSYGGAGRGDLCENSDECTKGLCCQKYMRFGAGVALFCEEPNFWSECL